jgi:phosphatidylserine/phosphatidylglycerophosphate/cardiolipin synthase-like enzyme
MSVEHYADAVRRIRQTLDALEEWLALVPQGSVITPGRIQQQLQPPLLAYDQVVLALAALASLGIVPSPQGGPFHQARYLETGALRAGVRAGIDSVQRTLPLAELRLLMALPRGLPLAVEQRLQREGSDLRAALVGLIMAAREHLVLASPFWDDQTANELGDLLERRLEAGVHIEFLGRLPQWEAGHTHGYATLIKRLLPHPCCQAFGWETPLTDDLFGTQTFHFKVAIADHGQQAYLGTANFTLSGLRSRMELGVLLQGEEASKLARILAAILKIATPVFPPA